MRTGIRILSLAVAVIGAVAALTGAVRAQSYPSKPVEFVVHTSPGGGTDLFARAISEFMAVKKYSRSR